jgi:hypothetical protein
MRLGGLGGAKLGAVHLISRFSGIFFISLKDFWIMEQGKGPRHLFGSATCQSFSLVHLRGGDYGVHGLGEGVLVEARICPT